MAYENLNNNSQLKSNFIIVLNDNEMSISKNVGGISSYLGNLRTAEGYHDLKTGVKKSLNKIPGIGPARRKALMKHFKGLEGIRDASREELAAVDSMNEKSAAEVYEFFHKGETKLPEDC